MTVICPGCGGERHLDADVHVDDILSCDACAGVRFRLLEHDGTYLLLEVPQASCPQCETVVQLPEHVQHGSTFTHCDRSFVVTYAYGTYALEPPSNG